MSERLGTFAGKGRKRPQVNIPLNLIDLDDENPRLAEEFKRGSQIDLLKALYETFNLEEIAYSMSENGYFDEEPIVVIPKKFPKDFDFFKADINQLQIEIDKLISDKKISFIVVEGNRRIATAKLLTDNSIRSTLKIRDQIFPKPKDEFVTNDLTIIPAIVYPDRTNISPYLGVRHIIGLLKWEAYAKALFLAKRIEAANAGNINDAINLVQRQTGDRSDVIKKQYLYYKLFKEAEEDLPIETDSIKDRFSLMTVAMNAPSIRNYISAPNYKEADFSKRLIPINKLDKYQNLLTWIFGDGKGKESIINDSRKITSELSKVLSHSEATKHLEETANLADAFDLSDGEKDFLIKKITDSTRNLKKALGIAWKYPTNDIYAMVEELDGLVVQLKKMLKK